MRIRVEGGNRLRFSVPRARVRGWSLGPIPVPASGGAQLAVMFENAALADREFTFELAGSEAQEVELDEIRGHSQTAEVQALERRLPPWTALDSVEISSIKSSI